LVSTVWANVLVVRTYSKWQDCSKQAPCL
jgi:hypothetical protein